MLYVDIPAPSDIAALATFRGEGCVSIYLRTTPITQQAQADRIELKNLARRAAEQLEAAGTDKRSCAAISEELDDLVDDDEFWRFQAHSLAIFVTPQNLRTFRLPNALQPLVIVSDRYHVKPLLRSVSFPQSCYVLALAQKSVRVVEVSPDLPSTAIHIEGMPEDAGRAVQGAGEAGDWPRSPRPRLRASAGAGGAGGYWPSGRMQGAEGQKVLLRQFARQVDKALRPVVTGSGVPLVLAAAEPLASTYRSVNSYPHLAAAAIEGNPEAMTEAQLGDRARTVLDGIYRDELTAWRTLFEARANQGRATTDVAQAARAATAGAVDSMLMDIDETLSGRIADDGAVVFAEQPTATNSDLVDEIATRVITTGGRVTCGDAALSCLIKGVLLRVDPVTIPLRRTRAEAAANRVAGNAAREIMDIQQKRARAARRQCRQPAIRAFDSPLPATKAICRCPSRSKGRSCPQDRLDLANVGWRLAHWGMRRSLVAAGTEHIHE